MGKKQKKNNSKILWLLAITVLILAGIFMWYKTSKKEDANEILEVFFETENGIFGTITKDYEGFSCGIALEWTDGYDGEIRKDGILVTKEKNEMLISDGEYEVVIKPQSGKKKKEFKVKIDKTGPESDIKENGDGTYTVTLKDIKDVKGATLDKFDLEKSEVIEHTDLIEKGLEKSFDIKEPGFYILKLYDEYDNVSSNRIEVK